MGDEELPYSMWTVGLFLLLTLVFLIITGVIVCIIIDCCQKVADSHGPHFRVEKTTASKTDDDEHERTVVEEPFSCLM